MGQKKEYRSAVRSRNLIRQAFVELLKEKTFEKITVTDIVKKADINRSTFYAHYPDVMGVVEAIEEEILDYTQSILQEMDFKDLLENPKLFLKKIVILLEENQELYQLLSNSNIMINHLEKVKGVLIERTINSVEIPDEYKNSFEFEFKVRFFMGGAIDVCTQWLNGDIECSLNELTEELAKLIVRVNKDLSK